MVFRTFSVQLVTQDYFDDEQALVKSSLFLAIANVLDIIFKLILAIFKLNKFRKTSIIVGLVIFATVNGANGYF